MVSSVHTNKISLEPTTPGIFDQNLTDPLGFLVNLPITTPAVLIRMLIKFVWIK